MSRKWAKTTWTVARSRPKVKSSLFLPWKSFYLRKYCTVFSFCGNISLELETTSILEDVHMFTVSTVLEWLPVHAAVLRVLHVPTWIFPRRWRKRVSDLNETAPGCQQSQSERIILSHFLFFARRYFRVTSVSKAWIVHRIMAISQMESISMEPQSLNNLVDGGFLVYLVLSIYQLWWWWWRRRSFFLMIDGGWKGFLLAAEGGAR